MLMMDILSRVELFKRLSSEEAKEVKSGYDWDYEYALKHYKYREHYGDYAIWR